MVPLSRSDAACPLRAIYLTNYRGLESGPMNEFGEPNMGNPSVRFDEGREALVIGPVPFNPTFPAYSTDTSESIEPRGRTGTEPFGILDARYFFGQTKQN